MDACSTTCSFCGLFVGINWSWYVISVVVVFGVGALWYSMLFGKAWMKVFKVEMPAEDEPVQIWPTMLIQLIATALLGLVFFILVRQSCTLAFVTLIGFSAWQKAGLKFRFLDWKQFMIAASIDVGYLFIAGLLFMLFASI